MNSTKLHVCPTCGSPMSWCVRRWVPVDALTTGPCRGLVKKAVNEYDSDIDAGAKAKKGDADEDAPPAAKASTRPLSQPRHTHAAETSLARQMRAARRPPRDRTARMMATRRTSPPPRLCLLLVCMQVLIVVPSGPQEARRRRQGWCIGRRR